MLYGLDGYVGYSSVVDTLIKFMDRGADGPNDPKILPNLNNGDLINEAIAAAVSLGPQPEAFVSQRSLMTMVYDDIGIVDYDKISFWLFGFKIQSLYYLYFAILSLSSSAFLLQFWKNPMAQVLLLCNLFAFWLELDTAVFNQHVPSFWGMRHGSTLAILPMWHVALLMVCRVRVCLSAVMFALIQIAILVLAIRIRGSAAWTVIFLASLVVFFTYQAWRKLPPGGAWVAKVARLAARWPVVLLLIGLLSSKLYTDARLHPAYFTDDIMPYHGAWHSAYLGIYMSPTLLAQTGETLERWGDRTGYDAALAYLRKQKFIKSEAEYISPWTGTYKMRLHDNTMRTVYLSLVERYPFTIAGLYLYWKPRLIMIISGIVLGEIPLMTWFAALSGIATLALVSVISRRIAMGEIRDYLLLAIAAALFASLPNIWAYAGGHTIIDLILCLLSLAILGTWAICTKLIELVRHRISGRVSPDAA
jgi:hypothetical protein